MNTQKQNEEQLQMALSESLNLIPDKGEIKSIRDLHPWDNTTPSETLKYGNKSYSISNEIVFSVQPMSVMETKLLRIILASTTENVFKDNAFTPFKMRVQEIAKLLGLKSKNSAYEKIYKTSWSLSNRKVFIETENRWTSYHWFEYISYEKKGHGGIIMQLSSSLKKYLIDLKRNFSIFSIPLLLSFKRKYSIHLYEGLTARIRRDKILSMQYNENEIITLSFSTKELRKLTTTLNNYANISDFKRYVINPAIDEISSLSDFNILDYNAKHVDGNRTNFFDFFIQKKAPISEQLANNVSDEQLDINIWSPEYIENIFDANNCHYSKDNIPYLFENYDKNSFLEDFKIAKTKAKSNITNYMVSMIENKHDSSYLTNEEEKLFDEIFNYWNDSSLYHEVKNEAHIKPVKYKTQSARRKFKQLLNEGISIDEIKTNIENANNCEFFIDNDHTFSYFLIPENFKRVANGDEKNSSYNYQPLI